MNASDNPDRAETAGGLLIKAYRALPAATSPDEAIGVRHLALMLDLDDGLAALSDHDLRIVLIVVTVSLRGADLEDLQVAQGPGGLRDYVRDCLPFVSRVDDPEAVAAAILRVADLYELRY